MHHISPQRKTFLPAAAQSDRFHLNTTPTRVRCQLVSNDRVLRKKRDAFIHHHRGSKDLMHILRTSKSFLAGATLPLFAAACLLNACSDNKVDAEPGDGSQAPVEKVAYEPTDCDPTDPSMCALPFPSSLYLHQDDNTPTGYALHFGETTLPPNSKGPISPDAWEGLDGFGVSTPIIFKAPNVDMSKMPSETDARSSWQGPIGQAQLFRVEQDDTLSRVPFFVERDIRQDASESLYYLRPTVILEENTHYVAMLRNLTDTDGNHIARSTAFDKLVNNQGYGDPELSGRQDHFNDLFKKLNQQGIARDELFLVWDFHTMSHEGLHGRMLEGRSLILDDMEKNGGGPDMVIKHVNTFQRDDGKAPNYDPHCAYELIGTFRAPQIVKSVGAFGKLFNLDADNKLAISEYVDRDFWIRVPYAAIDNDGDPTGLIQYGHGLLGQGNQVRGGAFLRTTQEYNMLYFGVNWTGMASPDELRIGAILANFSNFRWLSDNMHQGVLEFIMIAKGMKHKFMDAHYIDEDGVDHGPWAQNHGMNIDPDELYYHGISQGGIYGATYVAVSPDIDLGSLGVPGMNYNLLIQRSVDFDEYFEIALGAYRNDPSAVGIAIGAAQSLWDMTDPASYYKHLSKEPFPGNNKKTVMLTPAKGDHQVSPLTNLIIANSDVGVDVMEGWDANIHHLGPNLKEKKFEDGKTTGSVIQLWDTGNPWGPPEMFPPTEPKAYDPHSNLRFIHIHQTQMMDFFRSGGVTTDVCEGKGCHFETVPLDECNSTFDPNGTSQRRCYRLKD